jgi:hypothetical protein
MDTFKPAEPSMMSQILGHPAVHISFIFIAVFFAVVFIKSREKESFLSQVEKIPKGVAVIEKLPPPEAEFAENPPPPPPSQPLPQTPPPPSSMPTAASAASASPAVAGARGSAPISPGTRGLVAEDAKHQTKVRVIYAEIDDLTLKKWVPEMQAAGQYSEADWRMGILPNIEKKMAEDRSIVTFETIQKSFDNRNPTAEWLVGKQIDQGDFGIKTTLSLMNPESSQVKAEMRLIRNIDNTDVKVMDSDFELPAKAGWVIWKVLNPKSNPPRELLVDPKSFFQIYKSARFKNGRSDFTILLVFDTPSTR